VSYPPGDELERKIGVSHGMIHALVMIKSDIGERTFHPIPAHHTRKLRERDAQVAPMRSIYLRLEQNLRELQSNIEQSTAPDLRPGVGENASE
jgi:hypothetical protein